MSNTSREDATLFDPLRYLKHYYSVVDRENELLLDFLARVTHEHDFKGTTVLDFGSGPTIYAMISPARSCSIIHMSDYLPANLEQIRRWLASDQRAFNWSAFVRRTLEIEQAIQVEHGASAAPRPVSAEKIEARKATIRQKVKRLIPGDVRMPEPLGPGASEHYDVVVSAFCIESVAKDSHEWQQLLGNVSSMVKPGGLLIVASLVESEAYRVGEQTFTTSPISPQTCEAALLNLGYGRDSIQIELVDATDPDANLYKGAILCAARKPQRSV